MVGNFNTPLLTMDRMIRKEINEKLKEKQHHKLTRPNISIEKSTEQSFKIHSSQMFMELSPGQITY